MGSLRLPLWNETKTPPIQATRAMMDIRRAGNPCPGGRRSNPTGCRTRGGRLPGDHGQAKIRQALAKRHVVRAAVFAKLDQAQAKPVRTLEQQGRAGLVWGMSAMAHQSSRSSSRRDFLRACGRWGALTSLGAGVITLARQGRVAPLNAACLDAHPCTRCAGFGDCGLPAAEAWRRPTTGEQRS